VFLGVVYDLDQVVADPSNSEAVLETSCEWSCVALESEQRSPGDHWNGRGRLTQVAQLTQFAELT
jgi:hypothetical protein